MRRHVRASSREGGRVLDCRPSEMIQYAGKGKRMKAKTLVFKFDGPDVNMQTFGRDFVSLFNNVYQLVESCSDDAPCVTAVENNCITPLSRKIRDKLSQIFTGANKIRGK